MSGDPDRFGQADRPPPLIAPGTRATLTIVAVVAGVAVAWHVAVTATTGVDIDEPGRTWRGLLTGQPLTYRDGDGSGWTVVVWLGVLLVAAVVGSWLSVAWRNRRRRRKPVKGFARPDQVDEQMGESYARRTAEWTRPTMTARQRAAAPVTEVGLPVGRTERGQQVVLSLEDHAVVVSPTGGGKTSDLMIPAALDAPGALIVTDTSADILDVIAEHRSKTGRVWVFDPMDLVGWPEPMVWDPVAGCRTGKTAIARGLAFVYGLGASDTATTNSGFFRTNAGIALIRLLHAAALSDRSMSDVISWAVNLDDGAHVPTDLLTDHPDAERMWASMLRNTASGAEGTTASTRATLAQAVEPLVLGDVLAWVTPRHGVDVFDPDTFVQSKDTLVLLADGSAMTNVAPLCTMLLQEVTDAIKRCARRLPTRRLDPPIRLIGDEIANVSPLPKLPELAADSRKYGLTSLLALQSLRQSLDRYGEHRGRALFDNMSAELVRGGISDPDTLLRYSDLIGEVELERYTPSYDWAGARSGGSGQVVTRPAMPKNEVRMIADGNALLVFRNRPPVMLNTRSWRDRPDAARLRDQERRSAAARSRT